MEQQSVFAKRRPRLSLLIPTRPASTTSESNPPTCHAEAEFASAIALGKVLGSGAYAVVKRAWRRGNGSALAVKCVYSNDSEHRRLAREEFDMLRSMKCPAVVSVFEMYEFGGSMYLCLELCNAGNVCSYVTAQGPFCKASASSLFRQVLQGVRYIHTKRIVHCDIKHENLLLHDTDAGLIIKLADFNSAQRVGQTSCAVPLSCRGTKLFCAPEIMFHADWNERVDIWSCGLCFYFMTYGCLPFDVSSSDTIGQLLAGRLPDARWDRTDALMTHLIKQCLTVDGKERPPALELAQHYLFFAGSSDDACSRVDPCKGVACEVGVLRQQSAHLPSCGLIHIHASTDRAASVICEGAGIQPSRKSTPVLRSGAFPNRELRFFAYARCYRDVDHAFRQLAHVKLMRSVDGEGFDSRSLAHTHY
eukprot:TRINITY_DN12333_c1_g1_i2.p1 TRINITY_DN12333_c1_g1~~TRINITY_DN12333_c1_g1_i2.p1  ORF type:complete len:482 (+),score=48.84 TRINITY_DN12333_c1_g1_i2:190-1446(+)